MFRKSLVRWLGVVFLLMLILIVGVMTTAAATADRFYVSRIIAWQEVDFHDYQRFPSRSVHAGPNEFSFEPPPEKTPEFLRKVSYRSGALEPKSPRKSMATPLWLVGGKEVTEPLDRFLADTHTTAFLVIQDDRLLYEGYFNGYETVSSPRHLSPRRSRSYPPSSG